MMGFTAFVPLHLPNGPLVDEQFKLRLALVKLRLQFSIKVATVGVLSILGLFTVAVFLRRIQLNEITSSAALALVGLFVIASIAKASISGLSSLLFTEAMSARLERRPLHSRFVAKKQVDMPPLDATVLFYLFLPPKQTESLLGDLLERHSLLSHKFGKGKADLWYWHQALGSAVIIVVASTMEFLTRIVVAVVTWAAAARLLSTDSLLVLWARSRGERAIF